jgi:hypothetical protein
MPTPNPTATNSPYAGHTPGPWLENESATGPVINAKDGKLLVAAVAVAQTPHLRHTTLKEDEIAAANARLIAAAPTLLQENTALRAALIACAAIIEENFGNNVTREGIALRCARAALAAKEVQS